MFPSFRNINKQNAYPCKYQNNLKGPLFHCQKCLDQKYLWGRVEITKNPQNPL